MKRITEYNPITTVAENDVVPVVDVSDTTQASSGSTKKGTVAKIADYLKDRVETLTGKTLSTGSTIDANVTVTEVLRKVYPVGSIYISTTSTNPNIVFGFGTWASFGAGKTLVGLDSGDGDFDEAEKTGGAKTHTLTTAEMPEHTHIQNAHSHTVRKRTNSAAASGVGFNEASEAIDRDFNTGSTTATNQNTGGDGAHNNLQPYIVTYFFKRTA